MAKGQRAWESRLGEATDALAAQFVASLPVDRRLYRHDIAGSVAHAQMLAEQALITRAELSRIRLGLRAIEREIASGRFKFRTQDEDIHMAIEGSLIARVGEAGKKLHSGRSRNDQVATAMRLWVRDEIDAMVELCADLQRAFVGLAKRDGQRVMPGYTHLQRAQPIAAGALLLAYVEQVARDKERLRDARRRVNVMPLGSGALAGSSLRLNRRRTAELLGFDSVSRNSIDATCDRDFCVEFVFALAMLAMHLSRWAEDWIIYASQEFGFVQIADSFCTGSSMMPQKRNPDLLELIRGKAGSVYGQVVGLLTMLKGQPHAYNRDMQEDKTLVFGAADTVRASLDVGAAMVGHTRLCPDRLAAAVEGGFLDATALAEYLVGRGLAFRAAHQAVGQLVARCEKQGRALKDLSLAELQRVSKRIDRNVHDVLGADNVAKGYRTAGSASPREVAKQIGYWEKRLGKASDGRKGKGR